MDPAISATAALFIGGLFLLAAGHKLADFARFQATVRAYRLVADDMAGFLAGLAVLAELVIAGMALSIGASWQQAGILGAMALLALYAGVILLNIARDNVAIDCGCLGFAARAPRLTPALALRNLVLVATGALALLPISARALTWLDFTAMAGCLAMLALLYAGFDLAISQSKKEIPA